VRLLQVKFPLHSGLIHVGMQCVNVLIVISIQVKVSYGKVQWMTIESVYWEGEVPVIAKESTHKTSNKYKMYEGGWTYKKCSFD
jgi:hypothetical protein